MQASKQRAERNLVGQFVTDCPNKAKKAAKADGKANKRRTGGPVKIKARRNNPTTTPIAFTMPGIKRPVTRKKEAIAAVPRNQHTPIAHHRSIGGRTRSHAAVMSMTPAEARSAPRNNMAAMGDIIFDRLSDLWMRLTFNSTDRQNSERQIGHLRIVTGESGFRHVSKLSAAPGKADRAGRPNSGWGAYGSSPRWSAGLSTPCPT